MLAHCNLKQNMCLCSHHNLAYFPFMHCPLVANQKTRWSICSSFHNELHVNFLIFSGMFLVCGVKFSFPFFSSCPAIGFYYFSICQFQFSYSEGNQGKETWCYGSLWRDSLGALQRIEIRSWILLEWVFCVVHFLQKQVLNEVHV